MPEMVYISKKEYEEMKAAIETLRDQEILKQIIRSEKEIHEGKTYRWGDIRNEF